MDVGAFAARLRARERVLGYWVMLDAPPATERIARLGYDYVCLDAQHGLIGYAGLLGGLTAVTAGGRSAGLVRVAANHPTPIGRALDAGAVGVIVPLVDSAAEAAAAVSAARYPPAGRRSFGPTRSELHVGPDLVDANATVLVIAMIETPAGLEDVEAICATPGVDGVYVGPSDLCLAVGGARPGDPAVGEVFEAALTRIREAAAAAGVAAGMHVFDGDSAVERLAQGFTFSSVSCDVVHLERAAAAHLDAARGALG